MAIRNYLLMATVGGLLYLADGANVVAQPTDVIYDPRRAADPVGKLLRVPRVRRGGPAGRLRLDVAESASADRGGYAAIVPATSRRAKRGGGSSEDEAEVMPPPDSHRTLTAEQKEMLGGGSNKGPSTPSIGRSSRR